MFPDRLLGISHFDRVWKWRMARASKRSRRLWDAYSLIEAGGKPGEIFADAQQEYPDGDARSL
jgi:hypothetical protein